MNERICAFELARSLLVDMPLWKRVEFLTGELLDINNLEAAAYAHNRLKMHCDDLGDNPEVGERVAGSPEEVIRSLAYNAKGKPNGGDAA